MTDPALINQMLEYIREVWRSMPPEEAPRGMWITQYGPLPDDESEPNEQRYPIQHVWLLQNDGLPAQEKSVEEYKQLWKDHPEEFFRRIDRHTYEFAHAVFAPYAESQDWYLAFTWGPLWGGGWRVGHTAPGVFTRLKQLWIS